MQKRKPNSIIPSQGGMFSDLIMRLKLIARLMADRRVNPWVKLLPIGALVYLISPIDLIPGGIAPIIGAVDDVAVVWFGASLFIELCPSDVVQEHMRALSGNSDLVGDSDSPGSEEIIDGEVTDIDDK
jgi:uncharacterized membrane protein YkvA (DUF1232 family)